MLTNALVQVIEAYIKWYGLTFDDAIRMLRADLQNLKHENNPQNSITIDRLRKMGDKCSD